MKRLKILIVCVMAVGFFVIGEHFVGAVKEAIYAPLSGTVIVLDAGHGGKDEGAMVDGVTEKGINMAIVLKLQKLFEQGGATVVLTRTDENDLSSSTASNHKREDMKNRINIINDEKNDLLLSIHLNSYSNTSVKGAQTFYMKENNASELLARCIQVQFLDIDSRMEPKPGDYYLLNNSRIPAVLIECGFLSNPEERDMLQQEEYQNKVANLIFAGTLNYFKELNYE